MIEQQPDQASLTERYVTEAVRFMRSARDEPFFLYFAHMYVHTPIYVQQRFADQSDNGAYGAAVESIDWATAVLLHELESLGLADDTIVIFTSDNGSLGNVPVPVGGDGRPHGGSNAPLRGLKGQTWEGGQRVPGIVRWPARIERGSRERRGRVVDRPVPDAGRLCAGERCRRIARSTDVTSRRSSSTSRRPRRDRSSSTTG